MQSEQLVVVGLFSVLLVCSRRPLQALEVSQSIHTNGLTSQCCCSAIRTIQGNGMTCWISDQWVPNHGVRAGPNEFNVGDACLVPE
jgi:hypothetical protein